MAWVLMAWVLMAWVLMAWVLMAWAPGWRVLMARVPTRRVAGPAGGWRR
jgi:hypothetical protein